MPELLDCYTEIERSIQQRLKQALTAKNINKPVLNSMISKADLNNNHAVFSIMQVTDVFNPGNGGGPKAQFMDPVIVNNKVDSYLRSDWPKAYDRIYQIEVQTDDVAMMRMFQQIVHDTFPPRGIMHVWDSTITDVNGNTVGGFTSSFVNYNYAGYINRDQPDQEFYCRIFNIRFEVFDFPTATESVPAIKTINVDFEYTPQS